MNDIIETEQRNIETLIYDIRNKQVMLDSDLAKLYQCSNGTKTINQAVSRHKNRFPDDFYFQLTKEEYNNLKSQLGTSSTEYGGVRKLPHVFTEEGIAMLSTVLRTEVAADMSIKIMRAFVIMKKYISSNLIEQNYYNNMIVRHDNEIKLLQESFKKFDSKKILNEIYFDGQIYDAYSKIIEIFKEAKNELIIIDGYADKTVLDIIRNINIKVILITKTQGLLTKLDIKKYNSQYNNLKIIHNDSYHDRYFIIDNNIVYHCGASINHAGSKTFSINKLEDEILKSNLLNNINILTNYSKITTN